MREPVMKAKKRIKLGNRWVGDGEPVYIVAELANNWDGEKDRARKLIDLAKDCGADAVKFQSFNVDKLLSKRGCELLDPDRGLSLHKAIAASSLPPEWHRELFDYAKEKGLQCFSAPYDEESVDLLVELDVPAIKIGSGEIDWFNRLKYIAKKGKPILMATGTSTFAEIGAALGIMRSVGHDKIVLLQCVTAYPSHFESANIRAMVAMAEFFDVLVGYSDHTSRSSIVPLGAVALGACVIEKHFTDDHSRKGPGHSYSMDPTEFTAMVEGIRAMEKALGKPVRKIYSEEEPRAAFQRRCLRAAEDIPKGSKITKQMIEALRPHVQDALTPGYEGFVVDRVTRVDLQKGDAITWKRTRSPK